MPNNEFRFPSPTVLAATAPRGPACFMVRGKSPFPLDMLRVDSCYAASTQDTETLEELILARRPNRFVSVTLVSAHRPTVEEWEIRGWHVYE